MTDDLIQKLARGVYGTAATEMEIRFGRLIFNSHLGEEERSGQAREVFVVMASAYHLRSDAVRGFHRRDDAEAFAESCREHEKNKPRSPASDAPEDEWSRWCHDRKAWESSHPAAPHVSAGSYDVVPVAVTHGRPVENGVASELSELGAHRLRMAEEYKERLVSACRDSGCPDGMDESYWIRDVAKRASVFAAALADERCKCCGYRVTDSEHRGCLRSADPDRNSPLAG